MSNNLKKPKRSGLYIILAIVILAVALLAYGQWSNRPADDGGRLVGFAECLKNEGAKFYGTFWCSHCQDQKDLFGSAKDSIPYIECSTADGRGQLQVCAEANIQGYPTWVFADGSEQAGTMTLEALAEKTGCELPN